jgi:hypothetical protein
MRLRMKPINHASAAMLASAFNPNSHLAQSARALDENACPRIGSQNVDDRVAIRVCQTFFRVSKIAWRLRDIDQRLDTKYSFGYHSSILAWSPEHI